MNSILNQIESEYIDIIENKKRIADIIKPIFIGQDFQYFKENEKFADLVLTLSALLQPLLLFPDEEINNKLRELNIPPQILIPFVELEKINREFYRLSSYDIVVIKSNTIILIEVYLQTWLIAELFRWFYFLNDRKPSIKMMENAFRRIKYARKNNKEIKSDFDKLIHTDIIEPFEQIPGLNVEKMVLQSVNGNINSQYLPMIFSGFIYYGDQPVSIKNMSKSDKISQIRVLSVLFDCFKIFVQNKALLSEEEFENRKDITYGGNYTLYKARRLKRMVGI